VFAVILFWLAAGATQAKIKLLKHIFDIFHISILQTMQVAKNLIQINSPTFQFILLKNSSSPKTAIFPSKTKMSMNGHVYSDNGQLLLAEF
jgi:hypothetical protein